MLCRKFPVCSVALALNFLGASSVFAKEFHRGRSLLDNFISSLGLLILHNPCQTSHMRKLIPALVAFVLLLVFSTTGWSRSVFFDGNKLYGQCTELDIRSQSVCLGYVMAISDILYSVPGSEDGNMFCNRLGATSGQIMGIVIEYLEKHPEKRHWDANFLVSEALFQAFHCK